MITPPSKKEMIPSGFCGPTEAATEPPTEPLWWWYLNDRLLWEPIPSFLPLWLRLWLLWERFLPLGTVPSFGNAFAPLGTHPNGDPLPNDPLPYP